MHLPETLHLTSNKKGWWKEIVGKGKLIDTEKFSVISFNIPGNGYDGQLIDNYKDFTAKDIAQIFYRTLTELNIDNVFAITGGSLGGGIAWKWPASIQGLPNTLFPLHHTGSQATGSLDITQYKKHTDKLKTATCRCRKMAMLFIDPIVFFKKFNRTKVSNSSLFNVESWLNHHGEKLNQRFHSRLSYDESPALDNNAVPEGETTESTFSK